MTETTEHFAAKLEKLKALVEKMESAGLPLEENIASYEKGIALAKECQTILVEAKGRVEKVVGKQGEMQREEMRSISDEQADGE